MAVARDVAVTVTMQMILSAMWALMMPLTPRAEAACLAAAVNSVGPESGELSLLIVMVMS